MEKRPEDNWLPRTQDRTLPKKSAARYHSLIEPVVKSSLQQVEEEWQKVEGVKDNAKVIALCEIVLRLEEKNEKARQFRVQALKNLADLTAQKVLNKAVDKGKVSQKGPAKSGHEDLDVHYHCKKAPKHEDYKSVDDFNEDDLPEDFAKVDGMLDLVRAQAQLTVLLNMKRYSKNRLEYDCPINGKKYKDRDPQKGISGSGFVSHVARCNEKCPCKKCKNNPQDKHAKVYVMTAAHIVFDEDEGKETTCYFDYDETKKDLKSCTQLDAVVAVESNPEWDTCCITFVAHLEWAENLLTLYERFHNLSQKVKWTAGVWNHIDKVKHLHSEVVQLGEKFTEMQDKLNKLIDVLGGRLKKPDRSVRNEDEDPSHLMIKYGYDMLEKNTNTVKEMLLYLTQRKATHDLKVKEIHTLKSNYGAILSMHGYKHVLTLYKKMFTHLKDLNIILHGITIEPFVYRSVDESDSQPLVRQFYNDKFPQTIVVSHPHICGKKISFGRVVKRNIVKGYDTVSYKYTATTCSGSSGGPVFVLGRKGEVVMIPHSSLVKRKMLHNRSGTIIDL